MVSQSTRTLHGHRHPDRCHRSAGRFVPAHVDRPRDRDPLLRAIREHAPLLVGLRGVDRSDAGSSRAAVPNASRSGCRRSTTGSQIVGVQPDIVTVDLDSLAARPSPSSSTTSRRPNGLELGDEVADPDTVEVFGPASVIERVVAARASVIIQPSGIDVDQDIDLVAIDELGEAVAPGRPRAALEPRHDPGLLRSRDPNPAGQRGRDAATRPPASRSRRSPWIRWSSLVEGDADQLAELVRVDTAQIPMTGVSSDRTCRRSGSTCRPACSWSGSRRRSASRSRSGR